MEQLPALPSPTGNTACSSPASTTSSSASTVAGSTMTGSCSCTSGRYPARRDPPLEYLVQEVQTIRDAWCVERQRYRATDLELQRVTKLLEACDASYQCLIHAQGIDSQAPLPAIAAKALEKWARTEQQHHLDALNEQIEQRSAVFKQKCREFLSTNRVYSDAAKAYFHEVEKFATWTAAKTCKLQADYKKYCQIMKEQGAVPQILYEHDDTLNKMADDFYDAWDAREDALSKAMEIAHLDGRPDLLMGFFTH